MIDQCDPTAVPCPRCGLIGVPHCALCSDQTQLSATAEVWQERRAKAKFAPRIVPLWLAVQYSLQPHSSDRRWARQCRAAKRLTKLQYGVSAFCHAGPLNVPSHIALHVCTEERHAHHHGGVVILEMARGDAAAEYIYLSETCRDQG